MENLQLTHYFQIINHYHRILVVKSIVINVALQLSTLCQVRLEGNLGTSLSDFIHEYGAPEKLVFDGHESQVGSNTKFQKLLKKYDIPFHVTAPRRPNENPAESKIRLIKTRLMQYARYKTT